MHNGTMIRWLMILNATGMKWWNNFLCINKHRINNTGWMMKWQWNGGVGRKANLFERMLNVFYLHFPTPAMEAMSRIYACKTERNLQIFGWCLQFKQSCPWATLSYFCLQNKAGKINAMRRVVSWKCIKRAQRYHFALECEEVSLQIEITTLLPKNHNLFVKLGTKRELEKKELRPQAYNAQYNTQGWGGCEKKWEKGGGGCGRLLYTILYMSGVK